MKKPLCSLLTVILCLLLFPVFAIFLACAQPAAEVKLSGKLPMLHAGSLAVPFAEINKEFKRLNPEVEIVTEGGGSAGLVRKVTGQGAEAGVLASADYKLIPQLMFPNFADWYIVFGSNQMVICYTDKSKFRDQINANNWYEILQKEGVTFGRSDPDQDPAGYRSLMVWQLAEKHYNVPGLYQKLQAASGNTMKPKADELVALVKAGTMDYAFEYDSVAKQNGLKYVPLPDQINLSSKKFEDTYSQAKVQIKGSKPGETITQTGEPILYAVTIPKNFANQELAVAWVKFLLSDKGVATLEAAGQSSIRPAVASDVTKLPAALKQYVK